MGDQIGFGFQADVVKTASFSHMLTGHVLKALSDGGVDTYAVAAAFWLGSKIPVRPTLSDTVHSHVSQLSQRCTFQSVLSRALSIGWGHSVPAVEMTRTRAGTNALLIIGALSTGTPPFQAAQCLSELLLAYGLQTDMLPSIDVLKGLVTYLAPFVQDLGFSKVIQHITDTATRQFEVRFTPCYRTNPEQELQQSVFTASLRKIGSSDALAKTIRQLTYTSQALQSHYMILDHRGSWLPAFASHVLGMSVELRHNKATLWASGGKQGSVVFQMGSESGMDEFSIHSSPQPLSISSSPQEKKNQRVTIEYLLGEALEYKIASWLHINLGISSSIHRAIVALSRQLMRRVKIQPFSMPDVQQHDAFPMNGGFDDSRALEEILKMMGVSSPDATHPAIQLPRTIEGFEEMGPATHGLAYLDRHMVVELATRCRFHYDEAQSIPEKAIDKTTNIGYGRCPCESVGRLIHAFASTAIALARCKLDPSGLRLQESVICGDTMTEWSRRCVMRELHDYDSEAIPHTDYFATHDEFFDHLGRLVCADYSESWLDSDDLAVGAKRKGHILGLSGISSTIYYSCIMQNDCYDELGRMIEIRSGRASAGGSFRHAIIEPLAKSAHEESWTTSDRCEFLHPTSLAAGSVLEPHHRPPRTGLWMDVTVSEATICLQLRTILKSISRPSRQLSISFMSCICFFLSRWVVPQCGHARNTQYEAQKDNQVAVEGFHLATINKTPAEVLVFALLGNKLEQLVTCGALVNQVQRSRNDTKRSVINGTGDSRRGVLQMSSCLNCSIRLAQETDNYLPWVVAGG